MKNNEFARAICRDMGPISNNFLRMMQDIGPALRDWDRGLTRRPIVPFSFLIPDYEANVVISPDGKLVTKKARTVGQAVVFLNQSLGSSQKLCLIVEDADRRPVPFGYQFGLTTCQNASHKDFPCRQFGASCNGRSVILGINCFWVKGVVGFEWKHHMIHVSGRVRFKHMDCQRVLGSGPVLPFIVLSGNVNSVRILTESEAVSAIAESEAIASAARAVSFAQSSASAQAVASSSTDPQPSSSSSSSNECVVCMESEKCVMCSPCNHVTYCVKCAVVAEKQEAAKTCPFCRKAVQSLVRIYL